ncbi:hypothetical protein V492_03866 [Pseudogymnoascus sp. VKM F-4246]|nr:hypothetical protein V492_03866 [Pseudogymnoascus sp. VKM F-4246]
MPVIQECLHSPTETCGFNCWYFWNVGKSPALRRQEIAEARYGRVLAWQEVVNPTTTNPVEEQASFNETEGSETRAENSGSTEAGGSQSGAMELFGDGSVVGVDGQGFESSMRAERVNGSRGTLHGIEQELSDHGMFDGPATDQSTQQLVYLRRGTEADRIEAQVETFVKKESRESEDSNAEFGPSNIGTEGGRANREAIEKDGEEWSL